MPTGVYAAKAEYEVGAVLPDASGPVINFSKGAVQ